MEFIFLRPCVRVAAAFAEEFKIAIQPLRNGLVNIHDMPGPYVVVIILFPAHKLIESVPFAVRRGNDAEFQTVFRDDGKKGLPDLLAVPMESELVEKQIGGKAARGIRVRGERRHAGAAPEGDFHSLAFRAFAKPEPRREATESGVQRTEMKPDALLDGLPRLTLAARQDEPARAAPFHFRPDHVEHDFKRRYERLAGLPGKHADLETGIVLKPARLIGKEDRPTFHRDRPP